MRLAPDGHMQVLLSFSERQIQLSCAGDCMMSQQTMGSVSTSVRFIGLTNGSISYERYGMTVAPSLELELRPCPSLCVLLGRYSLHGSEEASFTVLLNAEVNW